MIQYSSLSSTRWRFNLRLIFLFPLLVFALQSIPIDAEEQADPAKASHQEITYKLQNSAIGYRFDLHDGHISDLSVTDFQNNRTLNLPEAFILTLDDGKEIQSSKMEVHGDAVIEDLPADASASRYSDRVPGKQICTDLDSRNPSVKLRWCLILRDGSNYLRQQITVDAGQRELAVKDVCLLRFKDQGAKVSGTVKGSPIIDATMFFGFEDPFSKSEVLNGAVTASITRVLPLSAGQSVTYSSVIGVAPPGQMRRAFLNYIERERAHPYRTFLHYNSWYDLGFGDDYSEADALSRVKAFSEELVQKRQVVLDSFLLDDGWDDPHTLWKFNSGFPDGFSRLQVSAAKSGFGIGVWLSPWGGYDEAKKQRIAFGHKSGYEIVKGGYALSGPRYYPEFERVSTEMIQKYGVNQFKIDGTGNADQVVPGSLFDSDFSAAIHLIDHLRKLKPEIYINLTTGTYPSPFWLRYADSIWRGGEDNSFTGVGSWRQRWITYRDAQTYQNIVKTASLFPLNSLMLHGLIYARLAENLSTDPQDDFAAEVQSYFGSGTQLQEMYITPSLLSHDNWETLAKFANWSRTNAGILSRHALGWWRSGKT